MASEVKRSDIEDAVRRTEGRIRVTPILRLGNALSEDWVLSLKLDQLQVTGSFKARGAFNVLLANEVSDGVVAASGGNFGKAIAYAAGELGVASTIFVPSTSPEEKVGQIAQYGAEVRVVSGYYDEALEASAAFAAEHGGFVAHAYDDPHVMAGQGTAGREIMAQIPNAASVLVAVGGGGLIGGVASWIRGEARVIAVEPEGCPSLHRARRAGRPVSSPVGGVASSSLGAAQVGEHTWIANQWIESSLLVTDEAILEAQSWLWANTRLWVEPAAATTIAALRSGHYQPEPGEHVVALVSGANVALGEATA